MNKKIIISLMVIIGILIIGTVIGIWSWQSSVAATKKQENAKKIDAINKEIKKVEATKDENNYAPVDVVRNFINEVRNDSMDKAKLYLATDQQEMDIKAALEFDKELDKITITDTSQTIDGDQSTVLVTGFWPTEDKTFEKNIILVKDNNLWKIKEIKGV
ncbi:MAG: hypothetical protein WC437_01640 [Patescibacteria group bacterium]|jgi:Tfp pilus assembly major pilin PilA|nr:hypothetical protein [Patescibacteria group bacterium]